MNRITLTEIEKATGGQILSDKGSREILAISTDSRKVKEGELFVPIIGEVHDAHKFIPMAYEKGCRAFLTSREDGAAGLENCSVILVEDTTRALQALSAWYLARLNLKTVAVTGSVGKTSTRDMVYYILKEKFTAGATVGNFNNDIGVPLTIFSFDDSMEAAVLEIGMDHAGEIHRLVDIIRPDVGIITNIGISHIENLGSRQGIFRAKMEITDYFNEGSCLVINQDNDILSASEYPGSYRTVRVGSGPGDDYFVHDVEDLGADGVSYILTVKGQDCPVHLNIPGAHNAINSALAIAACGVFGITPQEAAAGLEKIKLTGKRLTVMEKNGLRVIDDTYNAAPDSMKAAISTLVHTRGKRKVAILGGMNELGPDSAKYHREVGEFAAQQQVDVLITEGEKGADIAEGCRQAQGKTRVMHFDSREELLGQVGRILEEGDVVIVKASRAMEMEQIVEEIMKEQE